MTIPTENDRILQVNRYYLITDVGTQWFHYLVKDVVSPDEMFHDYTVLEVPNNLSGPFLGNIYGRELNFTYKKFPIREDYYYGWSLSEKEFGRIKRLIELQSKVDEYNRLIKYE